MSWLIGTLIALALALAPVLLGMPGFMLFGVGCLVLVVAAMRDPSRRGLRVATLLAAFVFLFLLYYLPALLHD